METIGFDGQTTMLSAAAMEGSTSGAGAGLLGSFEAHGSHGHVVVEPDEIVLEGHLCPSRPQLRWPSPA